MRTQIDLSPYFPTIVGVDRLARLLETATARVDGATGYPPYNIEKTGDNAYRITLAVAGFGEDDLDVTAKDGVLEITGRIKEKAEKDEAARFIHRGIGLRAFTRQFNLADYVRVSGASLANGLLHVDLVREVPEAMKPRKIEIGVGAPKSIEAKAETAA